MTHDLTSVLSEQMQGVAVSRPYLSVTSHDQYGHRKLF
jgi:hypothetical protein